MQAQPSERHWTDIAWFLFVSAILGLTCGVAVGGVAVLLAAPAYGAESASEATLPEAPDEDEEEGEDAPLVCTDVVFRTSGEAIVVCRPRNPRVIQARLDARYCLPS